MAPELAGLEIVWPEGKRSGDDIEIDISPGEDHIIIVRRTGEMSSWSLSYRTHAREFSHEELVQKAKEQDTKNPFGDEQAFFRLYNTTEHAVFYFENPDPTKTLEAEFNLELKNLALVGDDAGETTFKITLGPGETGYKILKAVERSKGTSIQMAFSFSAT